MATLVIRLLAAMSVAEIIAGVARGIVLGVACGILGLAGNAWELSAVVAVIYALCLLVCGWRQWRGGA
jgi:hypothetical protein